MYNTFNPTIKPQTANIKTKVRETSNNFGDGYEQDVRDGLNAVFIENMDLSWPVLTFEQGEELYNFFFHNSGRTFLWSIPGHSRQHKWRCSNWDYTLDRNMASFTATIREVFA